MSDDKVNGSAQRDVEAMPGLTQIPTSVTLSAEQFEKLYLNPMMHRQTPLTRNLGNPTPLYDFPTCTLNVRYSKLTFNAILGLSVLMSLRLRRSRVR